MLRSFRINARWTALYNQNRSQGLPRRLLTVSSPQKDLDERSIVSRVYLTRYVLAATDCSRTIDKISS